MLPTARPSSRLHIAAPTPGIPYVSTAAFWRASLYARNAAWKSGLFASGRLSSMAAGVGNPPLPWRSSATALMPLSLALYGIPPKSSMSLFRHIGLGGPYGGLGLLGHTAFSQSFRGFWLSIIPGLVMRPARWIRRWPFCLGGETRSGGLLSGPRLPAITMIPSGGGFLGLSGLLTRACVWRFLLSGRIWRGIGTFGGLRSWPFGPLSFSGSHRGSLGSPCSLLRLDSYLSVVDSPLLMCFLTFLSSSFQP